jgi:S-adenosylmethionine decarboxylase
MHHLGKHIILDFYGAKELSNKKFIEQTLIQAAKDSHATVLQTIFHSFGLNQGITGVVILAESHISIHTWPETSYAAIDIFMCGKCNPQASIPTLIKAFKPEKITQNIIYRGV